MSEKHEWTTDFEGFLPTKRSLVDWDTDRLVRPRVFAPNGANTFDLTVSTISATDNLYRALTDVWAENHPLLRRNVTLTNMEQIFRAYHYYMTAELENIKQGVTQELNQNQTKTTLSKLEKQIERDRLESSKLHKQIDEIAKEVEETRHEITHLQTNHAGERYIFGNNYITLLIMRKSVRSTLLQQEMQCLLLDLEVLQKKIVKTLNESLKELVYLRETLAKTPDLFVGFTRTEQVANVLPYRPDFVLPKKLWNIYVELYDLLSESTVREIIKKNLN